MKETIKAYQRHIFLILFSILPIIDSLNGFLVKEFDFSLGIIYKCFLILFLLIILIINIEFDLKKLIYSYRKMIYTIVYILLSFIINHFVNTNEILINFFVKISFNIVLFYTLYLLLKNKYIKSGEIDLLLHNQSIIIILCFLLPYILGLGYYSYSGQLGYKGFFYSNNELNATLVILFFYNLYELYTRFNIKRFIITTLIVFSLLLISSKSSIIVTMIGIICYLLQLVKTKKIVFTKKSLSISILFACVFLILIYPMISDVILRQSVLFNNFSGNIISTVTSGRNLFVIDSWNDLVSNELFALRFLFGNGFHTLKLIEMDIFDIFFYLGLFGVIIFVVHNYYWIKFAFKNNNSFFRILGIFMLFLFSTFTGHIYFTATAGTYFIIYVIYTLFS